MKKKLFFSSWDKKIEIKFLCNGRKEQIYLFHEIKKKFSFAKRRCFKQKTQDYRITNWTYTWEKLVIYFLILMKHFWFIFWAFFFLLMTLTSLLRVATFSNFFFLSFLQEKYFVKKTEQSVKVYTSSESKESKPIVGRKKINSRRRNEKNTRTAFFTPVVLEAHALRLANKANRTYDWLVGIVHKARLVSIVFFFLYVFVVNIVFMYGVPFRM